MALYLGNQKVSLRSGQDPTFDYGFDSNGRLVFANKNATEINNFLNYDSTYSEILDLSNLSKMERVAVNGTADRKMEGLKGLLVSPNAPFTGSSPQINVSYTGMSKSALVSLFESAPYNVGYEKVGNPTIVDGVASEFSANDYLSLNANFALESLWEICTKIKQNSFLEVPSHLFRFVGAYATVLAFNRNNGRASFVITCYNSDNVRKALVVPVSNFYPQIGVWYLLKFGKVGNAFYRSTSLDNGQTWKTTQIDIPEGYTIANFTALNIGAGYNGENPCVGCEIDLNETYIKVNGVPWFTGKPAMTKTCSIVGCTGTADLTQEDKNIILKKGWSLTVQ